MNHHAPPGVGFIPQRPIHARPAAEWGTLIANGRHFLITAPWVSLLPGLFLVAVVFSLNHIARTFEEIQR